MKSFVVASLLILSSQVFASNLNFIFPYLYEKGNNLPQSVVVATVDEQAQEIMLNLYNDLCGSFLPQKSGEFRCMAMASLEQTYQLKITGKHFSCGSTVYEGILDQSAVDGPIVKVQLQDNANRVCTDLVPSASAKLSIQNKWTNQIRLIEMTSNLMKN